MIALPPATEAVYHNGAPEGERNTQLFRMALQFRDQGLSQFDAESEAEIWGFKNGLTQNECVAAVKSAYSKPAREAWRPKAKYGYQNGAIVREDLPVPPMPISVESGPVDKFLTTCFDVGDSINICRSIKDGERERPFAPPRFASFCVLPAHARFACGGLIRNVSAAPAMRSAAAVWKDESKFPLLAFSRCATELSRLPAPHAVKRMP